MSNHFGELEISDILSLKDGPISKLLLSLSDKYGMEYLRDQLSLYMEKMEIISRLNMDITAISAEGQEKEYTEVVQKIITATQDYYGFIGSRPDDVRQLFTSIISSPEHELEVEALGRFLGKNMSMDGTSLLSYQSIRPRNYIMQIDAITNHLANLKDKTQLKVGKRGNQPILTTVTLDMPDHMRIEGGGKLTTYDKSIVNGVTSLLESGNMVFSIPMLYHAMTGRQNPTVDDQLYEEIAGKLEKMRRMMLTIDLTEENEAQYITGEDGESNEVKNVTLEGYLLPLNKVTGDINGKRSELYQVIQHPPLYTYSKMRRQLASVRINLLNAPVNNNSTTIPLKTYLLQRIEMMKNQKNNITQTGILYESIYQELGASDANKTKKMRIRNYTTTILEYYVKNNYIKAYIEYRIGRSVAGVQITL